LSVSISCGANQTRERVDDVGKFQFSIFGILPTPRGSLARDLVYQIPNRVFLVFLGRVFRIAYKLGIAVVRERGRDGFCRIDVRTITGDFVIRVGLRPEIANLHSPVALELDCHGLAICRWEKNKVAILNPKNPATFWQR
jgi:hypothetical protein